MWIKKGSLSEYKSAVKSNNRKWSASLLYNHNNSWSNEVDKSNIKSFSVSDYSTDGSNITMGCVAGSKVTINLINVPKSTVALWKDGETKIKVALNLDSANVTLESVPCVIDSKKIVKRLKKFGETENRVDVTLTAYDVSYLMTYNFRPSFTKGTALEFVAYIADKYNLLVGSSVQNAVNLIDGVTANRQFDVLSDLTDKQTLGYMAGCYGCYAYINNYNEIEFGWYKSNGETVAPDRIFESGFYVSDMEQRKIVTLETGTQNNVLTPTVGGTANGYSIKFENPYINQAQVNAIYNQKIAGGKTSFRVGKIKYKGDPLNVPGTILSVEDIENETATFYVMKRTLNFDGGLSETIECQGESESTIKYKAFSPMQQKIDKAISRLEEAAKGATDVITQTKGGVFELTPIDPDNPTQGNKGFTITATEETNRNNKIVANIGGIGFSTDGGETIDAAAIYFDKDAEGNYVGRINAELIEAGSIGADKLQAGSITADKIVTGDMANLVVADPVIYNTWNGKTYEDTSTYLTYFSVGNTASTAWGNDIILNRFYGADTFKVGDKFRFRADVIATVANLKMVLLLAAYNESGQKIVNLIDHRITLTSGNQSVDFVCEVNKSVGGVPVAYHQVMVGLAAGVMGNFYFRNASLYKMTNGVLIEDGAITAEKIAAGSITTDLIDSDVLTIGNISGLSQGLGDITSALEETTETANAAHDSLVAICVENDLTIVNGAKIATGTITADKVAIGSVNDLSNADPKSQTWGSAVGDPNNANATFPDAPYFKIVSIKDSWGKDVFLSKFASHSTFNVGDKFKFRANARFVADNAGASGQKVKIAIVLRAYDKDNKKQNLFAEYLNLNASSNFSTISHECTVSSLPDFSVDYYALVIGTHTDSNNGILYFNNTSCIQMSNNVLIADGAITADKIEAEAVTAEKIAAGAITAEKINVGWQSGNCATGWTTDKSSYITITSDSSYNYNPKITMSSNYTSGNIDVNGTPFYASAGDVLRFGGRAYKNNAGDNGIYLKFSSTSNGTYNVVSYQNTAVSTTGSTTSLDQTYQVTESGWYRMVVAFNKQKSGAYVTNLYCYKEVKGEMIVNGKISSVDGNTYFDLDNEKIVTKNSSGFSSEFFVGGVVSKHNDKETGGLKAVAISGISGSVETLWFNDGLYIGVPSGSSYDPYMTAYSNSVQFYKPINLLPTSQINFTTTSGDPITLYMEGSSLKCKMGYTTKTLVTF